MSAAELIAEINDCFQHEPRLDEMDIVYNNSPAYPEVLRIREAFKTHTWQALPEELMRYEQDGFIFLSKKGLKYYWPAYLRFAVRDYVAADSIPDSLVFFLTLPTEVDVMLSAVAATRYPLAVNTSLDAENEYYQSCLRDTNERVHSFIDNYGQFNQAQSRAILYFLEYMRDEHGEDFFNNEPAVAIERYWFQFA